METFSPDTAADGRGVGGVPDASAGDGTERCADDRQMDTSGDVRRTDAGVLDGAVALPPALAAGKTARVGCGGTGGDERHHRTDAGLLHGRQPLGRMARLRGQHAGRGPGLHGGAPGLQMEEKVLIFDVFLGVLTLWHYLCNLIHY